MWETKKQMWEAKKQKCDAKKLHSFLLAHMYIKHSMFDEALLSFANVADNALILSFVHAKGIPCLLQMPHAEDVFHDAFARDDELCNALNNLAKLPEAHEALLTAGAETLLRKYASEPKHAKYAETAKATLAALGLPA